jgi:signal transduction histidine kinase
MGLRERAYLLGGEVRIESGPGRGTIVEARIPVEAKAMQS